MTGEGLTVQERIDLANEAKRLLDSPTLADAMAAAREEVVAKWLDAQKPDPGDALAAWATCKALELVLDDLRRKVSDGVMASRERTT